MGLFGDSVRIAQRTSFTSNVDGYSGGQPQQLAPTPDPDAVAALVGAYLSTIDLSTFVSTAAINAINAILDARNKAALAAMGGSVTPDQAVTTTTVTNADGTVTSSTTSTGRGVTSFTGTANQIKSNSSIGDITVGLDTNTVIPGFSRAQTFETAGLPGAQSATRFAGGVVNLAPTTGTFLQGDYVVSTTGYIFVCVQSGTPGTWQQVGGNTSFSDSVVMETTFDKPSQAGLAQTVSRGDHTHGAPPLPVTHVFGTANQIVVTGNGAGTGDVTLSLPPDITFTGEVTAKDFRTTGLIGAQTATRWVGGTVVGSPTTGTFSTGDYVISQSGVLYICVSGGSPGTWYNAGSNPATTVTSETSYGIAPVVGVSLQQARADHTHGSPQQPVIALTTTGAGLTPLTSATGVVTLSNTGVTSIVQGSGIITSGATGAVTVTNDGVLTINSTAQVGISVNFTKGNVLVSNTGVTSVILGTGSANLTVSAPGTGAVALTMSNNPSFATLGVSGLSSLGSLRTLGLVDLQTVGGTSAFKFDPGATNADGFVGLATFPQSSVNGISLLDGSVSVSKLSAAAQGGTTRTVTTGSQGDSRKTLLRLVVGPTYADNDTAKDGSSQFFSKLTTAATFAADSYAFGDYCFQGIAGTHASGTVVLGGPFYGANTGDPGLTAGDYVATVYARYIPPSSGGTATSNVLSVQMSGPGVASRAADFFTPAQMGSAGYVGLSIPLTITADTKNTTGIQFQALYQTASGYSIYVSHVTIASVNPALTGAYVSGTFERRVAIVDADIQNASVTKLIAGTIQSDDIQIGTGGRIYIGASKSAATRQEWTAAGFKSYAGDTANPTVALNADGTFQLRSATTGNRINLSSNIGIELYAGTTRTFFADQSTGSLFLTGNVTATGGSFTGDIAVASTGSLYLGAQATTGQRLKLTSTGLKAYLPASTSDITSQSLSINNDGSISFASNNFTVDTNGFLNAKNAVITGNVSITNGGTITIGTSPQWFKVDASGNSWAGSDTFANAQANTYAVSASGVLYAQNATIKGAITATSGTFTGDVQITTGSLYAGASATAGQRLRVTSAGITAFNTGGTQTLTIDTAGNITSSAQSTFTGGTFRTSGTVGNGTTTGNGAIFDVNGFRGYAANSTTPVFNVDQNGYLTATKGLIANFSISGNNLNAGGVSASSINLDTSLGIYLGGAGGAAGTAPFRVTLDGALYTANLNVSGTSILSGTLTVSGTATLTGIIQTSTTIGSSGNGLRITPNQGLEAYNGTTRTFLLDPSGNISILGTFVANGAVTTNSTLTVGGNTFLDGVLNLRNGRISAPNFAVSAAGTLSATGATLTSLLVNGSTTLRDSLTLEGALYVPGSISNSAGVGSGTSGFKLSGATGLEFYVSTTRNFYIDLSGNVISVGTARFDGNLVIGAMTTLGGPTTISGATTLSSTLTVSGTISGGNITGASITGGSLNINGGIFQVTTAGAVTASNITITGGGITLGAGAASFNVDNAGNMWLGASAFSTASTSSFAVNNAGSTNIHQCFITSQFNINPGSNTQINGTVLFQQGSVTMANGVVIGGSSVTGTGSGSSGLVYVDSDLRIRAATPPTGTNYVTMGSDGHFYRSGQAFSSLLAAKTSIQPMQNRSALVMQLAPKNYKFIQEVATRGLTNAVVHSGLIAEDVQTLGIPELLITSDLGVLEGVDYNALAVLLLPMVQDHERRLKAVEDKQAAHGWNIV